MKSVFGLSENIAAALSYVLGPISGIAVLVLERENKFVRFHALQSTLWFFFLWVLRWVLSFLIGLVSWVPILGWVVSLAMGPVLWIGGLIYFGSKLYLMFRAYSGATFKLPVVGDVVWAQINK